MKTKKRQIKTRDEKIVKNCSRIKLNWIIREHRWSASGDFVAQTARQSKNLKNPRKLCEIAYRSIQSRFRDLLLLLFLWPRSNNHTLPRWRRSKTKISMGLDRSEQFRWSRFCRTRVETEKPQQVAGSRKFRDLHASAARERELHVHSPVQRVNYSFLPQIFRFVCALNVEFDSGLSKTPRNRGHKFWSDLVLHFYCNELEKKEHENIFKRKIGETA